MSEKPSNQLETTGAEKATLSGYITGFVLSLICTLVAYWMVQTHIGGDHQTITHSVLAAGLIFLAALQFLVQAIYFLHLGRESAPRWNLVVFSFMITVVVILVAGSMWIMTNLDYRHEGHMSPSETEHHLLQEEGFEQSHHH